MNFKVGDKVLFNGNKGFIKSVMFNSIRQEYEYYVEVPMANMVGLITYCISESSMASQCVLDNSIELPEGYKLNLSTGDIEESSLPDNKACDHVWIDVGFSFSKMVCKKCDVKQS